MPDSIYPTIIVPLGNVGYATDLPKQARSLTHYEKADNCIFEVGGQVGKFGGAEKINSVAMSGGPNVTGTYDYWFGGGATVMSQKFIAVTADSKVYKEDMDGTFDDITGTATITAGAIPIFSTATNLLVIAFNTRDVILKWDGAAAAVSALDAGAPRGKGFVFHCNRGWIWDASNLYCSAYGDLTAWPPDADTGTFVLDSGDGDEIIGAASHTRSNLIIFKGPNKGSIWTLQGTALTGSDAFGFPNASVRGIPLQSHNSIIPLADGDLAFMSPRGIHLLSAVQKFGNFAPSDITRFLRRHFKDKLSRANQAAVWGVDYKEKKCLLWATTTIGTTENNQMFGLDYGRLPEDGWKAFTVTRGCNSLGIRKHPTTKIDELVTGNTDGFVRRQDTASRNIDTTTAYSFNLISPRLLLGQADAAGKLRGDQPITIEEIYVRSESAGNYTLHGNFNRDNLPGESYAFTLGNTGGFIMGQSLLQAGGIGEKLGTNDAMEISYSDPAVAGECRGLKFTLTQGGLDQNAKLLELGIEYTPAGQTRISPVAAARFASGVDPGGPITQ